MTALAKDVALALAVAMDLATALVLALAMAMAMDLALALALDLGLAMAMGLAPALALAMDLALAIEMAMEMDLALAMVGVMALVMVMALATVLAMTNNVEYMRKYALDRYHVRRAIAVEKLGAKCGVCSGTDNLKICTRDAEAKNDITRVVSFTMDRLLAELPNYILLCAECSYKHKPRPITHGA